jgi:hypothetical protein
MKLIWNLLKFKSVYMQLVFLIKGRVHYHDAEAGVLFPISKKNAISV